MGNYKLSRLTKNNLKDILPISKSAFGKAFVWQDVVNKYSIPGWSESYIGYISYDEKNLPVAYYGVFPCKLRINKKIIISSQSGDTMTHSEHKGKGLFVRGATLTYQLAEDNGITSVFGFPSSSSQPGFFKLGWNFHHVIKRVRVKVLTLPVSLLSAKSSFFSSLHLKWFKLICRIFPVGREFSGSIEYFNFDGLDRNDEFWGYKMRNDRLVLCKIDSINCVLKFDGRKIIIGDVDVSHSRITNKFIFHLKLVALVAFIPIIDFYSSPELPVLTDFQKYGKLTDALPYGGVTFDRSLSLHSLNFTSFDFDTF